MVIGGIAVILRGVKRTTTDIDVAVKGDTVEISTLLADLERWQIVPRIADAEAFARESMVILLRHSPSGVDIDLSLAWSLFESEALDSREQARFGRVSVPTARAEDLVIYKQIASRPRDLQDVETLLALYPEMSTERIAHHVGMVRTLLDEVAIELGDGKPLTNKTPGAKSKSPKTKAKTKANNRKK
jgi:hypothetical protein